MEKYCNFNVTKSQLALMNALFDERKKKKLLSEIKINYLCKKVNIGRSTFYLNFNNILNLNEQMERYNFYLVIKEIYNNSNLTYDNFVTALIKFINKFYRLYSDKEIYIFKNNLELFLNEIFCSSEINKKNKYLYNLIKASISELLYFIVLLPPETNIENDKDLISMLSFIWQDQVKLIKSIKYHNYSSEQTQIAEKIDHENFLHNLKILNII